jgi:hypothetical protein
MPDVFEHARKLERERNEARHEIEGWRNKWECAVEMAARAELDALYYKTRYELLKDSREVIQ